MQTKKINFRLLMSLFVAVICIISVIAIAMPQKNEALSLNSFPYTEYAYDDYDECRYSEPDYPYEITDNIQK